MFEVGIVTQFEAAHRLRGNFGPASRTHGHTYRVEISVRGSALAEDGTLLDISALQEAATSICAAFHYRDLDDLPEFAGRNSTAENVARCFGDRIAADFQGRGLGTLSVRVWESPQAYGGYEVDLR